MKDLKYTLEFALKVIKLYGLQNVYDENDNNLKECIEEQLTKLKN